MNQDRIRDRILRRASRMWGYNESETENSFDPLVGLLISACASELEKLSFEQENSRARIIDRILEVMFPEEVAGALPAHTLLQVYPSQNNKSISLYNSFATKKRVQDIYNPQDTKEIDITFFPTIPLKLTTAKVKYIAYGNELIEQESFFSDEQIAKGIKPLPSGELWIGIENTNNEPLEDLQFFINVNNNEHKELFYHYLKLATVSAQNKKFTLLNGYNVVDKHLDLEHIITKNNNSLASIYNEVNQFYQSNFYTLKGVLEPINSDRDEEVVSQLYSHFSNIEEQIKEHIQWIRFEFSTIVHSEVFRSVRFMLNCVPVINIEHRKFSQMLKGSLNIFPLPTKHHFLDIDYIIDGNQNRIDLKNHQSKEQGIVAVVRRGGVARLDNREATELLQYLLEVIKNEAAAFAAIGGNYTKDVLKEIFQHIASLEQRKDKQGIVKDNNTYLIISTTKSEEQNNCEVAFWHTSGAEGNGLRAGTKCSPPTQSSYFTAPATMLKTSIGGRNRLTSEEKLLELRSALLSRGKIVTIADIETFGMSHFKSAITAIEVTKGTKKEVSTTQGFSRTIDIYLTKNNTTQNISPEEWEYLKESFMLKLKSASANMYPYRLFERG